MTDHDRREFLKRLAKTAAYSAPVMYSLAAPIELVGQGQSASHKHQHRDPWASPQQQQPQQPLPPNPAPGGPPPWEQPPPGSRP